MMRLQALYQVRQVFGVGLPEQGGGPTVESASRSIATQVPVERPARWRLSARA